MLVPLNKILEGFLLGPHTKIQTVESTIAKKNGKKKIKNNE
jgi:hypothetical protein